MAEIQARITINKTHKGQRVRKYNVQSLENEEVQQAFRSKIMEFNESTYVDEESQKGIEKQWSIREKIMKEAAESAIGMQGPSQMNDWFDDECAAVTSLKNKAYKNVSQEEYKTGERRISKRRYKEKKIRRRKKREAWKELMEEMEEAGRQKKLGSFIGK